MEVQICIRRTQDVQGNADAALPGPPLPPQRVWVYSYRAKRLCSPPPLWVDGGWGGGGWGG